MSAPARDPELEDLVVQTLERVEREGEGVLEDVLRAHPSHAAVLRERFAKLRAMGLLTLARPAHAGGFPELLGDFRLLSRLGEGGMGVVFLAEQISLGRRVALKLLRPERVWFGDARERFRREVEAVARLADPRIVPVYTVGEEGGIPYFAMEHVAGASLADAIARFQGRESSKLSGADLQSLLRERQGASDSSSGSGERRRFEGSWIDCCLSIAHDVALALQHAHERGVLHRDVKPSNVMLTASGRVLLLDFGLAALQGSERLTQSGAQLGSLAYMAPEQVEGRTEAIGPATDVYALGATLYELLTLRLPHRAATSEELALRILSGAIERPRRRNRALSSEVETVVLTALELDPGRRYQSAGSLARDLANVLERRPIQARRASTVLRVRRWAQRHPGWAAASGLALAVVTLGPSLFALEQRRARLELAAENERAEANLASAMEAIDFLARVGQDELAGVPQAEEARRRMLEGALEFYGRFAAQRGGDPRFRRDVAGAEARVGDIFGLLGRHAEASAALERAIAGYEALLADGGSAALPELEILAVRRDLAVARGQLGDVLRLGGDRDAALAAAKLAVAELDDLALRPDSAAVDRAEQARAHGKLGEALEDVGDRAGATAALAEATALWRALDERGEADADAKLREAGALTRLAELELVAEHGPVAEEHLERASELLAGLPAARSSDPRVREQRARTAEKYAAVLISKGDFAGAHQRAAPAVELASALDADFPRVPEYRELLAAARTTLGITEHARGSVELAAEHFEGSIELYEELCARYPDAIDYQSARSGVQVNLVVLEFNEGRHDDALARAVEALEGAERVLERAPADVNAQRAALYLRLQIAQIDHAQDRYAEALAGLEALVESESPVELAFGAGLAAACAVDALESQALEPDVRESLAAEGRERALALLRRAREKGLRDRSLLEHDRRLLSLRDEPGFREVFEALSGRE